jgi:hypothetical protein
MIEYRVEPSNSGYRILRVELLGEMADRDAANTAAMAIADQAAKTQANVVFDPAE